MESLRNIILIVGGIVLVGASIFLYVRSYKFYREVQRNAWGKLVLAMVTGWLITMYSLGIVSAVYMIYHVQDGVAVVLPVFCLWVVTMLLIFRIVLTWNKQAAALNKFNIQLQVLIDDRTKELQSEKTKAEAERNKLQVIIAGIKDGVLAVDQNKTIVMSNEAVSQITGFSSEELIGSQLLSKFALTEGREAVTEANLLPQQKMDQEKAVYRKEQVKLVGKAGEKYVSITVNQITESESLNLGYIIVIHDITEQVSKDTMKLDFVSMAAHELRTPLTSITSYLSVLTDEKMAVSPEMQKEYLQRVMIAGNQLKARVENILNITKLEKGTMKMNVNPVEWVGAVRGFVDRLMQISKQKNIDLSFREPETKILMVNVDVFLIEEVVTNLVQNALNHTQAGGEVWVTIHEKDGDIITTVSDNGEGIPKDAQKHLFTKFFRVTGKLESGAKGTGLGLYLSKAFVEMHHGQIWVDSDIGKGSAFSFSLPKAG